MAMIEVEHLTKYYGSHKAVDDISFNIEEGEIVGFLGPNGAGKSTTIRILTCYMPASEGRASVGGFDVFKQSIQVRKNIGYLPENTPVDRQMRVREYLNFRGKLRGLDRATRAARIRHVAEMCWMGHFIERPINQLSKGMRQRVGLADALLHNPPVLILDEPTVGLDPTQIRETRGLVKELAKNHTVLLCSHILPEVEATCQRIIVIAAGKIVATGSPKALKESIQGDLIVELAGQEAQVADAIGRLKGIRNVQTQSDNGWCRLRVSTEMEVDPREEIFALAKNKGWPLRELRREVASLEDFFVQITHKQLKEQQVEKFRQMDPKGFHPAGHEEAHAVAAAPETAAAETGHGGDEKEEAR